LLDSLGQVHWVPDQEELAMLQACNCDLSQLGALRVITNEPLTVGPLSASVSETEIDLHSLERTLSLPYKNSRAREIRLIAAWGSEVRGEPAFNDEIGALMVGSATSSAARKRIGEILGSADSVTVA